LWRYFIRFVGRRDMPALGDNIHLHQDNATASTSIITVCVFREIRSFKQNTRLESVLKIFGKTINGEKDQFWHLIKKIEPNYIFFQTAARNTYSLFRPNRKRSPNIGLNNIMQTASKEAICFL